MPLDDPQTDLPRALRELRARHDMSQEELARRAGLHRTSVTLIETGNVSPTWGKVEALAKALNVTVAELAAMAEGRSG